MPGARTRGVIAIACALALLGASRSDAHRAKAPSAEPFLEGRANSRANYLILTPGRLPLVSSTPARLVFEIYKCPVAGATLP